MSDFDHQPGAAADDLLRTKLAPPRPPAACVPRAALLTRIDDGLARKVTLIAAPAGFGKTTLVADWLRQSELSIENAELRRSGESSLSPFSMLNSQFSTAWVTLDAGDNDPVRFWRYVMTACGAWDPALAQPALAALRMVGQPAVEAALVPFINGLAQLPGRRVLVLEDYHSITAPEVHATLAFLIDHLPDSLHIMITSRGEPALPLARLRARDDLTELTAADLRFSPAEVRQFLGQTLGSAPPHEVAARIERRTEGWAAGLRLVALALRHSPDPADAEGLLAAFSGDQRHVVEYLVRGARSAAGAGPGVSAGD